MYQDEGFIQAIRAEPDDNALRLIYADWLEEHGDASAGARARFIRLQCERARLPFTSPRRAELIAEEGRLLCENWEAWMRPLREALGPHRAGQWFDYDYRTGDLDRFSRGFIESFTLSPAAYIDRAAELLRLTPLRFLCLTGGGGSEMGPLAQSPYLRELLSLSFVDYYSNPLGPEGARCLAQSPHLSRLRVLWVHRNNTGDEGVAALAEAPWLAQLTSLSLTDNGLSAIGFTRLSRSTFVPRPEVLRLASNLPGARGIEELAGSPILSRIRLLDLENCGLADRDARALRDSSMGDGLEVLSLRRNLFGLVGWRVLTERFGRRVQF
jgi:uncharacterized protein (TIGR02996 family)